MPPRLFQFTALPLLLAAACALPAGAAEPAKIASVSIGFAGQYKLGTWAPVSVEIEGLEALAKPRLEVVAPDGQGAPAVVASEPAPDASGRTHTLTRVGRRDATLRVRLLDGDQVVDHWRSGQDLRSPVRGLDASTPLIIEAGRQVPLADLPTDWLAYEGVDVLVFSGLTAEQLSELTPVRSAAIQTWVRSGGRVLIGGGQHAEALVGPAGPLRMLSPGEFVETVALANTGVIEDYVGSDEAIDAPFGGLAVGRLGGVSGVVELYAGGRASEMPLVVRSLHGFGSVTYTAFDLNAKPLAEWKDAGRLRTLLLQTDDPAEEGAAGGGQLVATAYADLIGAVHVGLGASFAGVQTVSILMLVAAVGAYLLLLGPGAYYLGKNVTGRMTTAWIVFPLVAVGVAGGAAWWGEASTGEEVRINQLELVDVDSQTGLQRGACWAQLFSPDARLYDLACVTPGAGQGGRGYLSWFGLPGRGLGGMQTSADSLLAGDTRYETQPTLAGLSGVPINRRASKPLAARWLVEEQPAVAFDLSPTGTGLVEGMLTNNTDLTLTDVKLIASNWAWRLPDLAPGEVAAVDAGLSHARLRTLVLKDFGGDQQGERRLSSDQLSLPAIAYLLMFYEALGGEEFSPLPAPTQPGADLSHALAAGRPIVVARAAGPQCQIQRDGEPLETPSERQGAFYRFLGPPLTEPPQ
ncbi:hypothetical protein KOR34_07050 [Posidoniimonas corsicana]|uniref:Glutamine amidotransferase domain-containing protein n=1 Tax=Posidoniimonas corsicana TaxID=1938618 RepID=A0A5C5VC27_9BACT|nr:hypothetical protein [Posidoniimonas corsicana]TWT35811.1 hypothetical protein KOR34_07050 [Posidoniimonas corsicana]